MALLSLIMYCSIGRFSVKNVKPAATGEPSKLKVKVRVNAHGIFGVMNAYIIEKTIVEEPPPPTVDTAAAGEGAASATPTTDTKEQTEKQEEANSMEDDAQKQQNGDTPEVKPKEEAEQPQTDDSKAQDTPPDVSMKSEGESQESESTGHEENVESMETEPASQQTQSVSEIITQEFKSHFNVLYKHTRAHIHIHTHKHTYACAHTHARTHGQHVKDTFVITIYRRIPLIVLPRSQIMQLNNQTNQPRNQLKIAKKKRHPQNQRSPRSKLNTLTYRWSL